MTTTVLHTKRREGENKIPKTSRSETAIVLNTKIGEADIKILNHDKYITTPEFSN